MPTKEKKEKIKVGVLDSGFNPRFESMFENQTIEYGYDFIDLMINSVILNDDGIINIVFNYRERELHVSIPFHSSTTPLAWSTIVFIP
ncbi:MAG: hypothetical protein K5762_00475 [Bacilli bacterium]|nr:hypothetical protein [Bacilli bacterium]